MRTRTHAYSRTHARALTFTHTHAHTQHAYTHVMTAHAEGAQSPFEVRAFVSRILTYAPISDLRATQHA